MGFSFGVRIPAGISKRILPAACLYYLTRRISPSFRMSIIAAAPGCSIISLSWMVPSGSLTWSTLNFMALPL
ncbi:MAG: hypothetical protein ACUVTM_08660 [Candidatus Bathyarchaeia archaeon]